MSANIILKFFLFTPFFVFCTEIYQCNKMHTAVNKKFYNMEEYFYEEQKC